MLNLNGKQLLAIAGAILSVLMVSTAQLTDLFGAGVAKTVVSVAGLANTIISSVIAAISSTLSQTEQVKQVMAMPGVENIDINKKASPELATLAVDATQPKISPVARDLQAVAETAAKAADTAAAGGKNA